MRLRRAEERQKHVRLLGQRTKLLLILIVVVEILHVLGM